MASSKPKTFDVRNFVKSENGRLTSLTLPRDLSLGGSKQKKVYKPNVNVVRNKNKLKEVMTRPHDSQQHQRRNQRNAHANKNNIHAHQQQQKYIKSVGLFSEGTAEIKRPAIHSDRYLSFREQDNSGMTVPKVVQNNWDIDVKEESSVINDLLGMEEESSSDDDGEYGPIILPLHSNKNTFTSTFKVKKEEPLDEALVKTEINSDDENNLLGVSSINGCYKHSTPMGLKNFTKLYDDKHPCISLIRMPDSLPGKGYTEDSDKPVDYNLSQMNEGKIGKILVRKSGKIEVYIGRTKCILDVVDASPFKETLMNVSENQMGQPPDLVDLGDIDEKYILSPSWKDLFQLKKGASRNS